ncbi:MAG TPA: beta-ketoacyl synthase N-terminal-like domain-containing protein [Acidiferrobacterales bacterium]|nr:beta-ketoacyl synthase N-terminal-like domain-containing protein [Acidiferrobacterales bacterium]
MPAIHIRGLGLVSSYGIGVACAVDGMRAGRTGITPLTLFSLPFQNQIQVNQFDHAPFPPDSACATATMQAVAQQALAEARLDNAALRNAALVVGTSSFLFAGEADYRRTLADTGQIVMPPLVPPGQAALRVAAELGIEGPVLTLTTACSSSANALLVATGLLRRGEVRRALVIGVEGLSAIALSGFHSLMLLDPEGCRPFDAGRRGMQIGEAVGAVLLEAGDAARGGDLLLGGRSRHPASRGTGASLLGGANLCDTHHMTSATPDGSAMRSVMQMALADAGLQPDDVAVIKAHGTGSLDNDTAEAAAMHTLFGADLPPFTGIKRYLGHTLGACGTVELAVFLGCLRAGFVPPTAGFTHPDPALRVTPLTEPRPAPKGAAMLNYFGFGGNYASLLIAHE